MPLISRTTSSVTNSSSTTCGRPARQSASCSSRIARRRSRCCSVSGSRTPKPPVAERLRSPAGPPATARCRAEPEWRPGQVQRMVSCGPSIAVLIAAQLTTLPTPKHVGCRRGFLVQRREKLFPFGAIGEPSGILDRGYRLRAEGLQLLLPSPPDELSPITTVRPPLLLLPAREAGRTEGDLLDHFLRYFIPHPTAADAGVVREARFQFLVCRAVGNTPWADALIVFLHGINGASVDEATCLAAT